MICDVFSLFSRQNLKLKISTMMIQTQASRQSWFLQTQKVQESWWLPINHLLFCSPNWALKFVSSQRSSLPSLELIYSCRNLVMFWFLNIWMTWQIVGGAKTGWVVVLIREIIKPFGRWDWSGNFIFRYLGQAANASSNNPWVTCWQYSPNQDSAILNDSQGAAGWAEDSLENNLSCCSSITAWQRLEELYKC